MKIGQIQYPDDKAALHGAPNAPTPENNAWVRPAGKKAQGAGFEEAGIGRQHHHLSDKQIQDLEIWTT